ncbi:unnamed protein product, partial [Amoebophrya sp. A120]|eukprot:GSA120T00004578001.1
MEFLTSNDEEVITAAGNHTAFNGSADKSTTDSAQVDPFTQIDNQSRDFFREKDHVLQLLREITTSTGAACDAGSSNTTDTSDAEKAIRLQLQKQQRAKAEEVKKIWNGYQEQPALLDGSLREMVNIMFENALSTSSCIAAPTPTTATTSGTEQQ